MEGKRVADVEDPRKEHPRLGPGEYRKVHNYYSRGDTVWEVRPPGEPEAGQGNLSRHEVIEHEDGTITVSPSILIRTSWAGEPALVASENPKAKREARSVE